MQAAGATFGNKVKPGALTSSRTGSTVVASHGEQQTRLLLLEHEDLSLCLISSDFPINTIPVADAIREEVAAILEIPSAHVLGFSTHNHCTALLDSESIEAFTYDRRRGKKKKTDCNLTPVGREFMRNLRVAARSLRRRTEPVSVWWGVSSEARIQYNRKGRRADGSTYFMREEDRTVLGKDFCGDVDTEAPVVCLKRDDGSVVAAIVQFAAHPVTAYHPERPVVHGEYPQVACEVLADDLARDGEIPPVLFLQGCCGDVNSKQMLVGGVDRTEQFGHYLGRTYVTALRKQQRSRMDGLGYAAEVARVPLARLPSGNTLRAEIREMEDFVRRAGAGDPETLSCVGLNFPRDLSPPYRARLVAAPLAWNRWALRLHERGRAESVPRSLDLAVRVVRIGDVGIVGMPCEPFQGIGRQIRAESPLPLAIPAGYLNDSHGYVPDAANTGDREYMSAFHRYTRFRPPFRKPAGDVLAKAGIRLMRRLARSET